MKASFTWANPSFQNPYNGYTSYYDVFKIVASVADNYRFFSTSSISTVGFLNYPSFNTSSPQQNIVVYGYPSGTTRQFDFTYYLQSGKPYYLVLTTNGYFQFAQPQVNITGSSKLTIRRTTGNNEIDTSLES